MALPRAIQAQVEQANATLEAMNKPPESAPAPVMEAAQAPVAEATSNEAVATPAPQAHSEPQATPQQHDVWEHKYKTLQGLFNREVPTLQNQVKDLKAQLEEAAARLNKAADEKAKPANEKPPVDQSDVDDFGADLVGMVQRVAAAAVTRAAGEFESKAAMLEQRMVQLEKVLQGTNQTVAVNAEQAFFDRLTKLVPDWETTNSNQAFLAWLAEVDPILGQPRQVALDAAQHALNADRAVAVFQAFTATQPAPAKRSQIDKQVSPKGTATAAPAPQPQAVIWTQQQVVDFYNAKRRGGFRGREQDALRVEADINQAIAEGRVR